VLVLRVRLCPCLHDKGVVNCKPQHSELCTILAQVLLIKVITYKHHTTN
jgi:hypothetical protein